MFGGAGLKFWAFIQAHRDADLIGPCLEQARIFDRIEIRLGPTEAYLEKEDDGTKQLVAEFSQRCEKSHVVDRLWANLDELKQSFISDTAGLEEGDWVFILDVDEFYEPEKLAKLLRFTKNTSELFPDISEFYWPFLHFWHDFRHVYDPMQDWARPLHQRFFRYQRGMRYLNHVTVSDRDGFDTFWHPRYRHRRYYVRDFYTYHVSFCRPVEYQLAKHARYKRIFDGMSLEQSLEDAKKQPWITNDEQFITEKILRYPNHLPIPLLESHPYAKLAWDTPHEARLRVWDPNAWYYGPEYPYHGPHQVVSLG
jgi:hypothetical protein